MKLVNKTAKPEIHQLIIDISPLDLKKKQPKKPKKNPNVFLKPYINLILNARQALIIKEFSYTSLSFLCDTLLS